MNIVKEISISRANKSNIISVMVLSSQKLPSLTPSLLQRKKFCPPMLIYLAGI